MVPHLSNSSWEIIPGSITICTGDVHVLNLRNSETQHHRANLRQLTSKLPGTPTRAELSVSEGRLNLNPSTTNASVGAIAPTEGSSL
mgnify:CR=1 FL=1